MADFSTCPGVLIAVPQLEDPNFHRSVILMIEHDRDGALGVVINHPIDHRCTEVTGTFNLPWPGHPGDRVRKGGPVAAQTLWMVHDDGWFFDETMRLGDGMAISRSRDALSRMCQGEERTLTLLVGYAGWGPGQLEQEIAAGSWIVGPARRALVFDAPPEQIWHEALAGLGIDPAYLVEPAGTIQ
jgi:putative transcriptional regulator